MNNSLCYDYMISSCNCIAWFFSIGTLYKSHTWESITIFCYIYVKCDVTIFSTDLLVSRVIPIILQVDKFFVYTEQIVIYKKLKRKKGCSEIEKKKGKHEVRKGI